MATIALTNGKGGVGKSTLALNLAIASAAAGRSVLAIDADPQQTLAAALSLRESPIAVASYTDSKTLRAQLQLAANKYDDIVLDCPGGADKSAMRVAMRLADKLVVPFEPRAYSVWSLTDMLKMLEIEREYREIPAYAVLSMSDSRGGDNSAAANAVPEGIEYLDAPIGRRKAIAIAASQGLSILETPGKDPKAEAEMRAFINAVFSTN